MTPVDPTTVILQRLEYKEKKDASTIKWFLGVSSALMITAIVGAFTTFIQLNTNVEVIKVQLTNLSNNYKYDIEDTKEEIDAINERIDATNERIESLHINI